MPKARKQIGIEEQLAEYIHVLARNHTEQDSVGAREPTKVGDGTWDRLSVDAQRKYIFVAKSLLMNPPDCLWQNMRIPQ